MCTYSLENAKFDPGSMRYPRCLCATTFPCFIQHDLSPAARGIYALRHRSITICSAFCHESSNSWYTLACSSSG